MASGYLVKNKEGKTLYYDPKTKKARNFNIPKGAAFKTAAKPAAKKSAAKPKPRTWRDGPKQGVMNKAGSLVIIQQAPKGGLNARVASGDPFKANQKNKIYVGPKR